MAYNKITLGGEQIIDLLYVGGNINTPEISSKVPEWDTNTTLIADFEGNLVAGNVDLGESISGNMIYRKKLGSSKLEFVKTVGEDEKYIVDYMVKNNSEYMYYLFPTTENATLLPLSSNSVEINHNAWSLMVVDETDDKNVFTLAKLFKFSLNFSSDRMSTNNDVNILKNFTSYPKIQKGNSNYWSGGLTSLIGFVHCSGDYIQTPNMMEELKALAIDGRRKFLRDYEGNLFEVEIVDSINIGNEDDTSQQVKSMTIKWVEVGSTDGLSVVNPKQMTTWLLTNTGTPLSYQTYVWDDNAVWDDNKFWTESILLDNEETYLGRTIDGGDNT